MDAPIYSNFHVLRMELQTESSTFGKSQQAQITRQTNNNLINVMVYF